MTIQPEVIRVYDKREYWGALHERADLTTVGQSTLPQQINTWIYRTIRRNLGSFARRHRLRPQGSGRLLEVGVGTGYWIGFWRRLGWQVDGCDLVPAAVQRLAVRFPGSRFWSADVSSPDGVLASAPEQTPTSYELITAVSVLLHVTVDEEFEQALANLAALLEPGGRLLLMEPVLTTTKKQPRYVAANSSRARILRRYVEPLRAAGLELVDCAATTALAANPLEGVSPRRRRFYQRWWALIKRTQTRPRLATVLGPAMYLGDLVLLRMTEAPTSKLLLFRKPA